MKKQLTPEQAAKRDERRAKFKTLWKQVAAMRTKLETVALKALRGFIGPVQLRVIGDCCRGEEKQFFFDKLCELAGIVERMPKTGQTEGAGDRATANGGELDLYFKPQTLAELKGATI